MSLATAVVNDWRHNQRTNIPNANAFISLADWAGNLEDEDEVNVWEDNWDDDNVEDDFNQQLRAQLESQKLEQN